MTPSKFRFTTETQRAPREFSYDPIGPSGAQAGDGDWIIDSLPAGRPSGTESGALLVVLVHRKRAYWKDRTLFV